MTDLVVFNGIRFYVDGSVARSFVDLTIKGSAETEEKTSGNSKYVSKKNNNPVEVSMTAVLDARTGCEPYSETMAMINAAKNGETGYLYIAGEKAVSEMMMLTDASAGGIILAPGGRWTHSEVQLTFKVADGSGGSGDSGSGSGGGGSSGGGNGGSGGDGKKFFEKIKDYAADQAKEVTDVTSSKTVLAAKIQSLKNTVKAAANAQPAVPQNSGGASSRVILQKAVK